MTSSRHHQSDSYNYDKHNAKIDKLIEVIKNGSTMLEIEKGNFHKLSAFIDKKDNPKNRCTSFKVMKLKS